MIRVTLFRSGAPAPGPALPDGGRESSETGMADRPAGAHGVAGRGSIVARSKDRTEARADQPTVLRIEIALVGDRDGAPTLVRADLDAAPTEEPVAAAPEPAPEPEPEPAPPPEPDEDLSAAEALVKTRKLALDRREKRVRSLEEALRERMGELEERESRLEERHAKLESAFELREDRIEERESTLADLDERLKRKEAELSVYVGQLQGELLDRSDW
jgi:DNA repair exonuclease SbcCD ATPase subunit